MARPLPRLPPRLRALLLALVVVGGMVLPGLVGAWQARDGRDYASFYAAARVRAEGGDPYDAARLTARVRADGVRRKPVYPFFYPPTALPLLDWTRLFDLRTGHRVMAALNLGALAGLGLVLVRWLAAPGWLVALLLATSSGAVETARLGQVNGLVALLVGWGLWRSRGTPVAVAALLKMSPLLLLGRWAAARQWRPLLVATAVGLGGLALCVPLLGVETSRRFFLGVLPSLGSGDWNGLDVPLSFRANHSLAGLLHALFPGPDDQHLSGAARGLSGAATLLGLGGFCWLGRRRLDPLGEGLVWGGLSGVLVVTPAYTWEHHFVLLLLPMAAVGTALLRGRLPRWGWALYGPVFAVWAWRQPWWRAAHDALPALQPVIEESKLGMQLLLIGLCAWGAARSAAGPAT